MKVFIVILIITLFLACTVVLVSSSTISRDEKIPNINNNNNKRHIITDENLKRRLDSEFNYYQSKAIEAATAISRGTAATRKKNASSSSSSSDAQFLFLKGRMNKEKQIRGSEYHMVGIRPYTKQRRWVD